MFAWYSLTTNAKGVVSTCNKKVTRLQMILTEKEISRQVAGHEMGTCKIMSRRRMLQTKNQIFEQATNEYIQSENF